MKSMKNKRADLRLEGDMGNVITPRTRTNENMRKPSFTKSWSKRLLQTHIHTHTSLDIPTLGAELWEGDERRKIQLSDFPFL